MSLSDCDLQGAGVLVTRPAHQALDLCALIEAHGGRSLPFPAIEILPAAEPEKARMALLQPADLIIYISPNAVTFSKILLGNQPLPTGAKLAAVGKGTAKKLRQEGHQVDLLPPERFDSEGLLDMPELKQVSGQRVVIVRGEGGRPLLGDILQERGADLVYAEVYRRHCPSSDPSPLLQHWYQQVDLVIVTSNEILINLIQLLGEAGWPLLRQSPLLVISQRMQDHAQELGFETVLRAQNASNMALMQRLCDWVQLGK